MLPTHSVLLTQDRIFYWKKKKKQTAFWQPVQAVTERLLLAISDDNDLLDAAGKQQNRVIIPLFTSWYADTDSLIYMGKWMGFLAPIL